MANVDRAGMLALAAAAALIVWGIVGFFDRMGQGWGGYTYSPDYVVNYVQPDGPGEEAGMEMGDRVISVEGMPVEELPLYSRWPRSLAPKVGESRRLTVERDGEMLALDVVYGDNASRTMSLRLGAALVGLCFMAFGLWAFLTVSTPPARILGAVGLAAGVGTFINGPYLGTWDGLVGHISFAAMILATLLLVQFFINFPRPKRVAQSPIATGILYGVWVAFLGCLALELIFHPRLYHTFGPYGSLLMMAYCVLALVALVHTVVTTPKQELRDSGMVLILVGLAVALVPLMLAFATAFRLPGSGYLVLLIVVIPLTMALAVRKQALGQGAQPG